MNRISQFFSYHGRYLIQLPSIYRPSGKPHVFIFATRRGGSTLIRDLIYSQPGFNYIAQPFNVWQYHPYTHYLPELGLGQYTCLSASEKSILKDYLDKLLSREYILRSQWQFWKKSYHWIWERYVVKILAAKAMIGWFEDTYSKVADIVYMTRHPIPTSLSAIKRGFFPTAAAYYLKNISFKERFLSGETIDLGNEILKNGSLLEKSVLNWCLENIIPLRLWKQKSWVTVSYESLVLKPQETCARLCQELNLPNPEYMQNTLYQPTRTTSKSSKEAIHESGPQARMRKWDEYIDEDTLSQVATILNSFEIDLYRVDDPLPKPEFDLSLTNETKILVS